MQKDFILDKYYLANQLRLALEEIEKSIKFKNFKIKISRPSVEDLDTEGECFLLKFELILLNKNDEIIASVPAVIMYEEKTFYFRAGTSNFIRRKRIALKKNNFQELLIEIEKRFKKFFRQLKMLDSFFSYFKDDDPKKYDFWILVKRLSQELYINNNGSMPTKRKKIIGKKYIGIIELHFFYDINQFVIEQKIFGPKDYKFNQQLSFYLLDEKTAIKEFAERWKKSVFVIKEKIESLEYKYKTQKFLIKKL